MAIRFHTIKKLGWLTAAALPLLFSACASQQPPLTTGVDFHMDTVVEQRWYGPGGEALKTAVNQELAALERSLSLYVEDSHLEQINQSAKGAPAQVPGEVFQLIRRSRDFSAYSRQSGGSVDLTVGALSLVWDQAGQTGRLPDPAQITAALTHVDWSTVTLDEASSTVALAPGQVLDLGAFAKGHAADVVKALAQEHSITGGFASVGSNIYSVGAKPDGTPFRFGVRDPAGDDNQYIGAIPLPITTDSGAVLDIMAVSGTYERYLELDGRRYHHIYDLDTGYPSHSGIVSVSVLSDDGFLTDALATHLLTTGVPGVLAHLDDPDLGVIAVDDQHRVYVSQNLRQHYRHTAGEEYQLYEG